MTLSNKPATGPPESAASAEPNPTLPHLGFSLDICICKNVLPISPTQGLYFPRRRAGASHLTLNKRFGLVVWTGCFPMVSVQKELGFKSNSKPPMQTLVAVDPSALPTKKLLFVVSTKKFKSKDPFFQIATKQNHRLVCCPPAFRRDWGSTPNPKPPTKGGYKAEPGGPRARLRGFAAQAGLFPFGRLRPCDVDAYPHRSHYFKPVCWKMKFWAWRERVVEAKHSRGRPS